MKLARLLRIPGTRFSPGLRESLARDVQGARPSRVGCVRARGGIDDTASLSGPSRGMLKAAARFDPQAHAAVVDRAVVPSPGGRDTVCNEGTEATMEAARASERHAAPTALTAVSPLHEAAVDDASGHVSGVYLVEHADRAHDALDDRHHHDAHDDATPKRGKRMILEHVTLVVYGWKNVEPGTLSWVFPSVGAAVAAARAMKNAARWAIVAGRGDLPHDLANDLDEARAHGAVLVEEAG